MKKTNILILLSFVLFGASGAFHPAQAAPQSVDLHTRLASGQEVIQLVNQVRASNGLPAYNVSGALMAAAQSHSQYQASIGSTSHTGSGGSSVTSRAIAAGYGDGAAVSVVENVFSGLNAGAQQAVNWWSNEGTHLATMLSTKHQDAGAGLAAGADGVVYITLVVGAVTGAPGSAETQMAWSASATGEAPQPGGAAQSTAAPGGAFVTATPGADGSIVHVVESGQTLWSIAALYKIGLADMLRINGLNDAAVIKPGQKIIIQQAGTLPTATFGLLNAEGTPVDAESEATATRAPTRTPRPTQAALAQRSTAQPGAGSTQDAGSAPASAAEQPRPLRPFGMDPLLLLIGVLVVGGAGLMAAGSLLRRGE